MNLLITTGVFVLVLGFVHGDTQWCNPEGHCFIKTSSTYNWDAGRTYCQSLGGGTGDLATIRSNDEKLDICNALGCSGYNFVGAKYDYGLSTWHWVDNYPAGYMPPFTNGKTSVEDIGLIYNNVWDNDDSAHSHYILCRIPPPPTDIGPCTNHGLDGQSCSFHFDDREQTCTAGTFSLTYDNCNTKCDLDCDLHPPRHPHCENDAYLLGCATTYRGYCQKDCGISTYVTSYEGCPNFPGWLMCRDYCCCGNTCGPQGPPGPPPSENCPYYTRRFPQYGTCDNRQGDDNDQVCPPVQCPDDMWYVVERCVCITKDTFGPSTWDQANDHCEASYPGGHLMMMRFQSEFTLLANEYTETRLWIAIRREEPNHPTFRYYPDGRKVTANLWYGGEPNDYGGNEQCVEAWNNFNGNIQAWNDANCGSSFLFICEIEPYMMP